MATIALLGTLDTKGDEHAFVAAQIRARGHGTLLIDVGTDQPPRITPDISREEVARIAGIYLAALTTRHDRGECVTAMAGAAAIILAKLHGEGKIDGVISLGGGGGTAIATAGMRALPLGFPKLMVSTLASGSARIPAVAMAVPPPPPREITPSIFPSACNFARMITAALAIVATHSPRS